MTDGRSGGRSSEGQREATLYLIASVPIRLVEEGARVALALAAVESLHDIAVGAALIAVFTAPSVIAAPVVGGVLDAIRSPRRFMVLSSLLFAAVIGLTAGLGHVPLPLEFVALAVGGCLLPIFLGGLSSFAGDLMRANPARGYAVDALSYNIAAVGGPAVVAVLSAVIGPSGALVALAVIAVVGGVLLQTLPLAGRGGSAKPADVARGIAAGTRHLVTHAPLARATLSGTINQIAAGATPVVAVAVAAMRGGGTTGAAWLVAGIAIGGIVGAAIAPIGGAARMLARTPPHRTMAIGLALIGVFTLVAAAVPGYALTFVALTLSGAPVAPVVAAMFRIRSEESPPALRAQVFTVGAGLRIAASAVGSGLIAVVIGAPAGILLVLIALPWLISAAVLIPSVRTPTVT